MYTIINGEKINVFIEKKNIKNTYIRVKKDLCIYVTTNHLISDKKIMELINNSTSSIIKMIEQQKRKIEKSTKFYLLGKKYDVVLCNISKTVEIIDDKVYVKDKNQIDKFIRNKAKEIFTERLNKCYKLFKNDNIPYPELKIRKMTRKWGYCNKRDKLIMLNIDLIKYNIDEIDYVIVHELCHFIHFNHSEFFWYEVKKHKPDYKKNKKVLKEE